MAIKISKREKRIKEKVEDENQYGFSDAISLLKELSTVKFNESVDVSVNLGVDPRKSDQVVRGASIMPNGTGRDVTVAVFAQGENAEKAKAAGADQVGFTELAESIKAGKIDFNVLIATPDAMRLVGSLGPILGPRGLMPNPKVGTVTNDVAKAVQNAKGGQVNFRTDKAGIIHCSIGKLSFSGKALQENLLALIEDLKKCRPTAAKGTYLKKISLSTTMGPGLVLDQAVLDQVETTS